MVGETETVIRIGHRAFWNSPLLNVDECGDMITNWLDLCGRGDVFYDIREAIPGDAVAYGKGNEAWTFGIFLSAGRIATTAKAKNCHGKIMPKLFLFRIQAIEAQGRKFVGGVHILNRGGGS